ncbi:hypothetical protein Sango_1260700 [Sesamum angolense]|uniref:Reverse transcriptase domain-containing protein n=1 Tax=Sesamum angolense TaxID=2727404 RepID=A0AAE1WQM3_9LAMI|nr:hypothetical protein Sango_1260700 [Sesamum angolense]
MVKRNAERNSILAITKVDGSIITSAPDITQKFVDFYTSLLGTEDQTLPVDDGVFHWGPLLTPELASNLYRAVTPAEVKTAVFQISDNKAPSPNGYTSCFFKKAWNIVGDLICRAVMDFFRSGRMLRQLNHTIIALVPKSKHSPSVADYRPISCCNVIYKIITKIIADRLSPALKQLIDSSQAAFVGGRNITDNIFLAQEMVRQYSRKWISPRCTINVDLRKAFDRSHGSSSPEYSTDFNFHPKCEKLKITHLLFADDLMLFSRGDIPSIRILMECLQEFRDISGLAVNTAKSNIFTAGIQNDTLDEALAMTEFARGHMPVRYLGIPLAAQRLSVTDYSPLVDQIAGCIRNWTAKSLSFAGRLEFIRSVIQGVECFWLQVFPLPMTVIEKIHRLCRAFLWNSKRALMAWEDICHPKEEGGLVIRHIQSWNVALLARVLWNIHCKADTLWNKWVNEVYLRGASLWDWQPKKGDSPLLRRLAEIWDRIITDFGSTDAAIRHMTEWTNSKGLVTSKAYEYLRPKLLRQPWKASIRKAFIPPKYSFILWLGLRERLATRDRLAFLHEDPSCSLCINMVWHHLTHVNPSQWSKVAQEWEDWLLCAEQSAASRFGMHGLQPLEAPQRNHL